MHDPVADQAAHLLRDYATHLQTSRFVPRRDRRNAGQAIHCLLALLEKQQKQLEDADSQLDSLTFDMTAMTNLLAGTTSSTPASDLRVHHTVTPCVPEHLTGHLRWEGLS